MSLAVAGVVVFIIIMVIITIFRSKKADKQDQKIISTQQPNIMPNTILSDTDNTNVAIVQESNNINTILSKKTTNIITLTMKGMTGTELVDIFDETNTKILENVLISKEGTTINIDSDTKFITIIFTNDNTTRDVVLEEIKLNGNIIPKEKAIQAQLIFNPVTNTERYNKVLNGNFHWGNTKYRINLQ